jgi:membrane-associated phospholipid phosphatase
MDVLAGWCLGVLTVISLTEILARLEENKCFKGEGLYDVSHLRPRGFAVTKTRIWPWST